MNYYLKLFILAVTFMILDVIWIMVNKDTIYAHAFKNVLKATDQTANIIYGLIVYLAMILGLFIICFTFVDTQIEKYKHVDKNVVAFLAGGFYGFIVNTIYNFTSMLACPNYSIYTSIFDVSWAIMLNGTLSLLYVQIE